MHCPTCRSTAEHDVLSNDSALKQLRLHTHHLSGNRCEREAIFVSVCCSQLNSSSTSTDRANLASSSAIGSTTGLVRCNVYVCLRGNPNRPYIKGTQGAIHGSLYHHLAFLLLPFMSNVLNIQLFSSDIIR